MGTQGETSSPSPRYSESGQRNGTGLSSDVWDPSENDYQEVNLLLEIIQ